MLKVMCAMLKGCDQAVNWKGPLGCGVETEDRVRELGRSAPGPWQEPSAKLTCSYVVANLGDFKKLSRVTASDC